MLLCQYVDSVLYTICGYNAAVVGVGKPTSVNSGLAASGKYSRYLSSSIDEYADGHLNHRLYSSHFITMDLEDADVIFTPSGRREMGHGDWI